eukprot:CAMPEP_0202427016 /NCGR_PEP_ID=MMETSP1345-20130828/1306_1 /ASSEMBLY_ACC=CAM_ASM_000843 /TAXON_ID=342563 /ORGANISM="Fabrea Fabrea salina" /LENGTH=128 /DNA_ID=CAMNT_0049037603 /DNA_START=360 /DNA_END=743 /DNA_ORIENTATION=+
MNNENSKKKNQGKYFAFIVKGHKKNWVGLSGFLLHLMTISIMMIGHSPAEGLKASDAKNSPGIKEAPYIAKANTVCTVKLFRTKNTKYPEVLILLSILTAVGRNEIISNKTCRKPNGTSGAVKSLQIW